jgi:hypothetical protein
MIRVGRYKKLLQLVTDALREGAATHGDAPQEEEAETEASQRRALRVVFGNQGKRDALTQQLGTCVVPGQVNSTSEPSRTALIWSEVREIGRSSSSYLPKGRALHAEV